MGHALLDQHEAEVVLRVVGPADRVDREPVPAGRRKHVDAAGLHGRPRILRMSAPLVQRAGLAQVAGAGPQAKRLVVSRQEQVSLQRRGNPLGPARRRFEQDRLTGSASQDMLLDAGRTPA